MRQLMLEYAIIASSFHPLILVHELGHAAMMKKYQYTIHSISVGYPIIYRKGLLRLGLLPSQGFVHYTQNPQLIKEPLSTSWSGPVAESAVSISASSAFHLMDFNICSIFFQHWTIGCFIDLLPPTSPNDINQKSDGSQIWCDFPYFHRWCGFFLHLSLKLSNNLIFTSRLIFESLKYCDIFL